MRICKPKDIVAPQLGTHQLYACMSLLTHQIGSITIGECKLRHIMDIY
jgi:hypothetical protein